MRIPLPTFSSTVAMLALFVALGGTSYAAITITGGNVRNGTLTSADLKDGSVKGADIRNGTISASDVKNGSLRAADFKSGELPAGPAGAQGPQGIQGPQGDPGPQGPAGATSVVVRRVSVVLPIAPSPSDPQIATAVARCNAGERVVGGGAGTTTARDGQSFVLGNEPAVGNAPALDGQTADGWRAVAFNIDTTAPGGLRVHAVCASP